MTKHNNAAKDTSDRPPQSEFGERFDAVAREYRKALKRTENALTFKGLSLIEAYVEGRMRIAVEFRAATVPEGDGATYVATWGHHGNILEASPRGPSERIEKIQAFKSYPRRGSDKNVMLVSNVEPVEPIELAALLLEGPYLVEDEILDGWAGNVPGSFFVSFQGRCRTLPGVVEGEQRASVDLSSIGFHEGAISVVERCSQVMDRIANDGSGVLGGYLADSPGRPLLRVGLGTHGFDVVSHVGPDNPFEVLDVMVGPFYL